MTLPIERSWAINNTREFLRSLLDPKKTPRVPVSVRRDARWCLKHFPMEMDMDKVMERCPEVFGKKEDL
jgi:hypothetical protein